MIRLLFFVGAGLILGGLIVQLAGPPAAGVWALIAGATVAVASLVLLMIGRSLRGIALPTPADIAAARAAGRYALVRIDALTQTGTQINDQPVCEIEATVQPVSGPAFRTRIRAIVALIDIPRVQPGTLRAALRLTDDGPEVALIDDDPRGESFAGVVVPSAATAGDILVPEPGTVAMKGMRRRSIIGVGRRGRPLRIVLFLLAGLAAAAVVVLPHAGAVAQSVVSGQGYVRPDLREPESIDTALGAISAEAGHDQVYSVSVSADLVVVEAPVVAGEKNADRWTYRDGAVTHSGPVPVQPQLAAQQFALADVDWAALWPVVEATVVADGYPDAAEASYSVRRVTDDDVQSETFGRQVGDINVVFIARDDYRSSFFRMNADASSPEKTSGD
ncbi:hypothetical protein AB0N73_13905 [Microbacterium sp. NPDC089189]|uniref:hypothetical protein n=1 Tax=Microbacterium sp. NPDC089189 TaxID=3154972 RepID=UPI003445A087